MIDHVGFKVSVYATSTAFYASALAPLGYGLVMEVTPERTGTDSHDAGFGASGKPDFWIGTSQAATRSGLHIALVAGSRAAVDAFHAAALAAGARDNGAPGLRPIYHPHYYGASVLDPDGHNIE